MAVDGDGSAMMWGALVLLEAWGVAIVPAHHVSRHGRCSCGDSQCGSPGKHPRFKGWRQHPLRDPEAVRAHWSRYPLDNVGIATGVASGVVVLDVDGEQGERTLAALVDQHGPLPTCPTVITARGRHLYFAAGSVPLQNTQGARGRGLGDGLDLRCEGGFVITPPSVHASGHVYRWENPC